MPSGYPAISAEEQKAGHAKISSVQKIYLKKKQSCDRNRNLEYLSHFDFLDFKTTS